MHRGLRRDDRRRGLRSLRGEVVLPSGDFGDAETYERVGREIADASSPVFYLEIPPSLFGMVIKGLAGAGLTDSARVVVEKPFGHDLDSAAALDEEVHHYCASHRYAESTTSSARWASTRLVYLRFANTMFRSGTATTSIRSRSPWPRAFGVEDRGLLLRPGGALRDVVVNHLMQVIAATRWKHPPAKHSTSLKNAMVSVFQAMPEGDPAHVRGQYDGYLDTQGVAADSTTETYAALRLDIDNRRWSGGPFISAPVSICRSLRRRCA